MRSQQNFIKDRDILNILSISFDKTGYDFRQYKESTIARRIKRRMTAVKCADFQQYADYLMRVPDEIIKLNNTLTINVTDFFRDRDDFEIFKKIALNNSVSDKLNINIYPKSTSQRDDNIETDEIKKAGIYKCDALCQPPLKIWSIGCSIGCEPYSLAILINEYLKETDIEIDARILATDIDESALKTARAGIYNRNYISQIPENIVDKYFKIIDSDNFKITDTIKNAVEFQKHSIISDKLYYGFDMIICRNLLIYFSVDLQAKAIERMARSLNIGGYLWLGKAEHISKPIKFSLQQINPKTKLYAKVGKFDD